MPRVPAGSGRRDRASASTRTPCPASLSATASAVTNVSDIAGKWSAKMTISATGAEQFAVERLVRVGAALGGEVACARNTGGDRARLVGECERVVERARHLDRVV